MTSATRLADEISPDTWIIVPNWDRFQHYRNRNPLWIKIYAKLLHDPKFLALSPASRGLLMTIWLVFSQESGQVTVEMMRRYGGHGVGFYQLIALNHAGFIEFSASKPLETKKEKEVEKEKTLGEPVDNPRTLTDEDARWRLLIKASDLAADWTGGASEKFDGAIDDLEKTLEARLSYVERQRLWDVARRRETPTPKSKRQW
jgi:hypothetical protein